MPLSNQPQAFNYQATERSVNLQKFTTSGTWVKPPNATFVRVCAWGGGGGGGGGARQASTTRFGGGGGGGGVRVSQQFLANCLTDTVNVTVGAGGAGGAGRATQGNANVGSAGGTSSFGNYLNAYGGGGAGGSIGSGGGGSGGAGSCAAGGAPYPYTTNALNNF